MRKLESASCYLKTKTKVAFSRSQHILLLISSSQKLFSQDSKSCFLWGVWVLCQMTVPHSHSHISHPYFILHSLHPFILLSSISSFCIIKASGHLGSCWLIHFCYFCIFSHFCQPSLVKLAVAFMHRDSLRQNWLQAELKLRYQISENAMLETKCALLDKQPGMRWCDRTNIILLYSYIIILPYIIL